MAHFIKKQGDGLSLASQFPQARTQARHPNPLDFKNPRTLVELLRHRADSPFQKPAYAFLVDGDSEEIRVSYAELDRQARAIATVLQGFAAKGERALLVYPPGLDYIAAFLGCLYAGLIAVPVYPPDPNRLSRTLPRLQAIAKNAQAGFALTTSPILQMNELILEQAPDLKTLKWIATDDLQAGLENEWEYPQIGPETLAFLQYTSGSTGQPKGVMLSHGNLLHNEELIKNAFGQDERSIVLGWLPPYHDMGLIGLILQPLYLGVPCILMSPLSFLEEPVRWLKAMSRYQATTSGGPNFAYDLCVRKTSPEERSKLDLSHWQVAFTGAEPISAQTIENFTRYFEPCGFRREVFYPCYGLAEATLAVSGGTKENPPVVTPFRKKRLVGCGRSLGDQKIVIANPETSLECPSGEEGEIWVQGPSVAQGYWQQAKTTQEIFQAYLRDSNAGPFLRTGDLGFLKDSELFITGRIKDVIIIHGQNHYPQDIEQSVQNSSPGLRPGCGAAFSVTVDGEEKLVVVQEVDRRYYERRRQRHQVDLGERRRSSDRRQIEVEPGHDPEIRQAFDSEQVIGAITQAISEEHQLQPYTVALVKPGTIPKTSSGKIQRHACKQEFLAHQLETIEEWKRSAGYEEDLSLPIAKDHASVEAWLKDHIANKLGVAKDHIHAQEPISRYGLDSLGAIELAHAVELKVGAHLPLSDFLGGLTLEQIVLKIVEEGQEKDRIVPKPKAGKAKVYGLSHGQQALWFLHQLSPESSAYNISAAVRIRGWIDIPALQRAFQKLVDRHPSLRKTFSAEHGEPVQIIHDTSEVAFHQEDASHLSEVALHRRLSEAAWKPFDLEKGPLFKIHLLTLSPEEHVLILVIHHIISDFWSLDIMVHELGILYPALREGKSAELPPKPSVQYLDYVRWQEEILASPAGERLWGYWQQKLSGELPALNLPTDRPRPAVQTYRGASETFSLSPELTEKLKTLAKENGVTLYIALLAAFQTLLHRYSGQEDILIGSPTSGRSRRELSNLVGYLVNPVVLRGDLSGNPSVKDLLQRTRATVLEAFEHLDYPFSLLVEKLQPDRDPSRSPIYQVMFVHQKAQRLGEEGLTPFALGKAGAKMHLGGMHLESLHLKQGVAPMDLILTTAEADGSLLASFDYNTDLFDQDTMKRMIGHFQTLLEGIVQDPEKKVASLPILTEQEKHRLLVEWNDTKRDFPQESCIHELFEEQVGETADNIAVIFEDQTLTYQELNSKANQLAHYLRKQGVGPETLVGICVERSLEMVIGVLGILKAGGAYVPLDRNYPKERLAFMLEDTQAPVLLTQEKLKQELPENSAKRICLDTDWEAIARENQNNPLPQAKPGNLAYIIYTSGSTGKPKGVAIEHRSTVALVSWAQGIYSREMLAGVLASTSLCFDLSVFELFVTWSVGGKVILAEDALQLFKLPAKNEVTLINTVPSIAELLKIDDIPVSVKTINCAGEPLKNSLVERIYEKGPIRQVYELYGPSEDTTYSTFALRISKAPGTIGRPIDNTQIYLLDSHLNPVPCGVPGEVYIGGAGLARGYLNRPELTNEKFISNPFSEDPRARLYKTGDLARYFSDGNLEFLSRIDHQVKIRGFRVELGEIESVLGKHPQVKETVVLARENESGQKQLVAYLVLQESQAVFITELRSFLTTKLPDYMVPSHFVFLDKFPLTPNGKIDRKALPAPDHSRPELEKAYQAPRSPAEEILAGIFAQVLGLEKVGIHDNFFELGGHSLLATQLISRVRESFEMELPLRSLFEAPTVAELSHHIDAKREVGEGLVVPALMRVPRDGNLPLSFAQERLWFLDQLEPGNASYNIPAAVRLSGELNVSILEQVFAEIVRRHEALRTTFEMREGKPVQVIHSDASFAFLPMDLSGLPPAGREAESLRLAAEEAQKPFDLFQGPLIRASLIKLEEKDHVLLLNMHHIVSDGWSIGVLIREVAELYAAFSAGNSSPLPELKVQYADFAQWQREWLQGEGFERQLSYWKENLKDIPQVLNLPTDRPRPAVPDFKGGAQTLSLSQELSHSLQELSRQEGATLFMTLLAAFQLLLSRYSGQEDIVVGSPIANRNRNEIEPLIGFFVNTLVFRADLSGNPSFQELLLQAKETTLGAYAHQDLPFEKLVEALNPDRDLARHPLFEVLVNFVNTPREALEISGLTLSPLESGEAQSKFPMTLYIEEEAGKIHFRLVYQSALFSEKRIATLLGQFHYLLGQIAASPENKIQSYSLVTPESRFLLPDPSFVLPEPRYEATSKTFAEVAKRLPTQVAVKQGDRHWTYRELAESASHLTQALLAKKLIPGDVVAVCGTRSFGLIAGMIAVLSSGGVLLTLDKDLPSDRKKLMLSEAKAKYLFYLGEPGTNDEWLQGTSLVVLRVDADKGRAFEEIISTETESPELSPDNPAYIFFTSGTTGGPKAVLGCHKGLSHFVEWQREKFEIGPQDRSAQLTGLSFDVLLRDVFTPLTGGATLCLPEEPADLSPQKIITWMEREAITVLHTVPSLANFWLRELPRKSSPCHLRWVFFAGEPLTDSLVKRWRGAFPETGGIVNLYGPTETSLAKCFYTVPMDPTSGVQPVGHPIPETQALVLAENGRLCGIGEPGEIVIRTPFRSFGYCNNLEETQRLFVKNPRREDENDLLYRTGDRGRYRTDGLLEILGRLDLQIKIRGMRVELGEIETALSGHPSVQASVVIAREEEGENYALVAYIVSKPENQPNRKELRSFLKEKLPSHMVPTSFMFLDKLPLTPNGKVDRKALPEPDLLRSEWEEACEAPRSPTEEILAGIFAQVLGLKKVGIHDNFFELGGHSLLATQLISRVRESFEMELPLRSLFEAPTVAELSHRIDLAREAEEGLTAPSTIKPMPREGNLPLSFAQERLWFLDQLEPGSPFYNIPAAVRLTGPLNVGVFEQTFAEILSRHESLRTTFMTVEGRPAQVIHPPVPFSFVQTDLSKLPQEEREEQVLRLAAEEAQKPFDLAQGPLLRASLLKLQDQEHVLLFTLHHIVSDGWSLGVLIREVAELYAAFSAGNPSPLPELKVQYTDFAQWQRQWLQGEGFEKQLAYWKGHLKGIPAVLNLPTDRPRPTIQSFKGATQRFPLSKELMDSLTILSRQEGTTLFMTLLAAFQLLLSRYSGQEDVVVGSPIANRTRQEIEPLIGFFVNTLVLRADLSGNPTFKELLHQVKETTLGAYAHQDLPFERLVEAINPERNLSHSPLFQVMFILQNAPMGEIKLPHLSLSPIQAKAGIAKFDLTLNLIEIEGGLQGLIDYNTDLFDNETIMRMIGHFQTLLEGIVQDPGKKIASLPILTEQEKHRLLVEWNDTKRDFPQESCIHELFEEQVGKTPDNVALVFEDQTLTYQELNAKANQLAHYLRKQGVGPETLVGICVERSLEMVIGLLGILKAGGAYVPLDPNHPKERISFMLEDTQVPVLLTQESLKKEIPQNASRVICLDSNWGSIARESGKNLRHEAKTENLAYVIYTSGSTGKPKGVQIPHRAVVNLLSSMRDEPGLSAQDRLLAVASLSFDVAGFEIFLPMTAGARVVLASREVASDGAALKKYLVQSKATVMQSTPATWRMLLETGWERAEDYPLKILCGGEALPRELVSQLKERSSSLWNLYGPTETTMLSTSYKVDSTDGTTIPIGHPIANTEVYILDKQRNVLPIGVPGELHIGGTGLARGYLNRFELTQEKFIPDPFSGDPKARLYKTGDLARYLPDGNIEFLGRIDHQVKIRGFRIELGEIEAVLGQHPQIKETVVVARGDESGLKRLVAYLITQEDQAVSTADLRSFLKTELPDYMVPSNFVFLDKFPLTPNGKIDRKALPAPDHSRPELEKAYQAPRSPAEEILAGIFAQVLGLEKVGVHDNFFELGGHSLLAVRLMAKIQQVTGKTIPLNALFQGATIEHLASILRQKERQLPERSLVPIQPQGSKAPFFCVHPIGGNVLCYYELARELGLDQPFYGLQSRGLDGLQDVDADIESMATHYIQEIKTVQKEGPYRLGGWSMGGIIAFEMARQLQAQGEKVESLVMIDAVLTSCANESAEEIDDSTLFASLMVDMAQLMGEGPDFQTEDFITSSEVQFSHLLKLAKKANLVAPDADLDQLRPLLAVFKNNYRAIRRYSPQVYSEKMTLLQAADSRINKFQDLSPCGNQWAPRGIVVEIPGDHYTIFKKPNLSKLAEKLKGCLRGA